jgi:hypothetical protein
MRLAEISYELDEYEMGGMFLSGRLEIEICNVDGMPYIWAMDVNKISPKTGESVSLHYEAGKFNDLTSFLFRQKLHADRRLMDDIYDTCLVEASYQKAFAS